MSNVIQITNWAINASGDAYTAPEARVAILRGDITYHPHLQVTAEERTVRTSQIRSWFGNEVRTKNSTYQLIGEPDPRFLEWLQVKEIPYDPANPLKALADHDYLPEEG